MGRKRKHNRNLPVNVRLKHGAYYYVKNSKWTRLGKTLQEAMQAWANLIPCETNKKTLEPVMQRYMHEIAPQQAKSTYKGKLHQAQRLIEVFGDAPINEITPPAIYQYMDARGKSNKVGANHELNLLSQVYKYAIRWGIVEDNPCRHIQKFRIDPHSYYISDNDFRLVASIDEYMGHVMILAYLTALRQGDILRLETQNIKEDCIKVFIQKTREWADISWNDPLRKCVASLFSLRHRYATHKTLVCNKQRNPYTSDGFQSVWQRVMKAAIEKGLERSFRFHDIRAKSATDAKEKHGIAFAQSLLNHQSSKITEKHYIQSVKKIAPMGEFME